MFNVLLAEGANPNWACPEDGRTPLHLAAQRNESDMILGLLRAGADIHATDLRGRNAFQLFVERKRVFGRMLFLWSTASYDSFAHLRQAYHAESSVNSNVRSRRGGEDQSDAISRVVEYEGVAVIHPGGELGLTAC